MRFFKLTSAQIYDAEVRAWFAAGDDEMRPLAETRVDSMRKCGADVRETLHDEHPTACVGDAAFAYVNAFSGHINAGFFQGADLPDPTGLLQGGGRFMRHLKVHWGRPIDQNLLNGLIEQAYEDVRSRLSDVF